MKTDKYQIRAAQIDLARQMEAIPFLKIWIDFLSKFHYNTLFLYVEWRIRTNTFDIGKNHGYSALQIREIVDYAKKRGMTVIPGLAALGHAEQVLSLDKFASYAELREGVQGRFGGRTRNVFCLSQNKTREFIKSYLADVCDIFWDSPYIHIGGDEAWDIGFCPECRDKVSDFSAEQQLYLEHILMLHQCLKKLNKNMMMWDDMFEYYQDILEKIPRDITMVHWQYQENVWGFQGHFCNLCFGDWLRRYDQLGFEYLIAPANACWSNVETCTAYADQYHPVGALLTSWEHRNTLLYRDFPLTAAAGLLWSRETESAGQAQNEALEGLFKRTDSGFLSVMKNWDASMVRYALNIFSFWGPDDRLLKNLHVETVLLKEYLQSFDTHPEKIIIRDILHCCIMKELQLRSERACWNLWHGQQAEQLEEIIEDIRREVSEYRLLLKQERCESASLSFEKSSSEWCSNLIKEKEKMNCEGRLRVFFALPEGIGSQHVKIIVNQENIAEGVFKHSSDQFYEAFFPLQNQHEIKDIVIESWGFGGQGIAYLSAENAKGKYVPAAICSVAGVVENPSFVLEPNTNFTFLGFHDTMAGFKNRSCSKMKHSLKIAMQRE